MSKLNATGSDAVINAANEDNKDAIAKSLPKVMPSPIVVARLRLIAAQAAVWNLETTLDGWRKGLDATACLITDFIVDNLSDKGVRASMKERIKSIQTGIDFITKGLFSITSLKKWGWAANMVEAQEAMSHAMATAEDEEMVAIMRRVVKGALGSFAGLMMADEGLRDEADLARIGSEEWTLKAATLIAKAKKELSDI